jgi:gluconokinase
MKTTFGSFLVMGVSGSGKSHVGTLLAKAIEAEFIDADDYHSSSNVAKMSRGEPLNDADRQDWLVTLSDFYGRYREHNTPLVIGCSALKRRYRDILRRSAPELKVLYLKGDREVLLQRLKGRQEHFFNGEKMLDSQFDTLEPPSSDEAVIADIRLSPHDIITSFLKRIQAIK